MLISSGICFLSFPGELIFWLHNSLFSDGKWWLLWFPLRFDHSRIVPPVASLAGCMQPALNVYTAQSLS